MKKIEWDVIRKRKTEALWPILVFWCYPLEDELKLDPLNELHVWINGSIQAVWEKGSMERIARKVIYGHMYKRINNLNALRKEGITAGENLLKYCKKFSKVLESKKLNDYIAFFHKFTKMYQQISRKSIVYWAFSSPVLEKDLNEYLKNYPEKTKKEIIRIMVQSTVKSYSQIEEEQFEKLVNLARAKGIDSKEAKSEINKFSKKYYWFPYDYSGPEIWDEKSVEKRIQKALKQKPVKIIEHNTPSRQKSCIKKYNLPKKTVDLFKITQMVTLIQDDRKKYNSHICYYFNHLIMSSLAKNLGITLKLARFIETEILKDYIKEKNKNKLIKRLKDRYGFSVVARTPGTGKDRYFEGDDGRKFLKELGVNLEQTYENIREIKGVTAHPGKIKGVAKVLFKAIQGKNFKEGEILVATMTTPDYAPIMKKSSAIITDEGGITCHAAIVSREMKKPCIIGTKIATEVLKDGDMVELDADKGIVRILK